MADDDNFDIDIYGDDGADTTDYQHDDHTAEGEKSEDLLDGAQLDDAYDDYKKDENVDNIELKLDDKEDEQEQPNETHQQISTTQGTASAASQLPKQAPVQQGVKRKEGLDDRRVEPGATSAIIVSEVQWWTTDDDIRGWANQCDCEDELKEITSSEHKVNGKAKGQVFIEFASSQAATAVKQKVESFSQGPRKFTVAFATPSNNPFKTVPKDVSGRQTGSTTQTRPSSGSFGSGTGQGGFNSGGFRHRGGMGSRDRGGGGGGGPGGGMHHPNFNRGFGGGPQMNGMGGNFGAGPMGGGGFGGPMNNAGGFNNFNHGGMMMGGMRGGGSNRGGFNNFNRGGGGNMMMGGMGGMGGMPMGGNMGMPMMGGMPGGFGGVPQGHFNPAFFPNQQMGAAGSENWNPHGAKRPRPE